jgi:glyoxylase I family protein
MNLHLKDEILPGLFTKRPMGLHHNTYTTDDHELTRQFYEEVVGMPGHAFYELKDGSAVAFFNFADPEKQIQWKAKEQSLFVHNSLLVGPSTQAEINARATAADLKPFFLEHSFCCLPYVKDPYGPMVEFAAPQSRVGDRLPNGFDGA